MRRVVRRGGIWRGMLTNRKKDGSSYKAEVSVSPVLDTSYRKTNIITVIKDVTERMRAENALRESERKFRSFLDDLGDIAYEIDENGIITYINKIAQAITGFPTSELIGKPFLHLLEGESRDIGNDTFQKTLRGEKPEYEVGLLNGKFLRLKNEPKRDERGKVVGVFGIARDITKRKKAEKALRAANERFKSIFENTTIGMHQTTPDGRILMANPALLNMLGYSSFEKLAHRDLEKGGYDLEYPRSTFKKLMESEGRVIGLESAWLKTDGTTVFVRESARTVRDDAGNTLYYEGTVEDITERRKAEEELQQVLRGLETRIEERTAELEKANDQLKNEMAERKQVMTALRESEEKWRSLVENAPNIIIIVDREGTIQFVNHTVPGFTVENTIGTNLSDYTKPEYHSIAREKVEHVFQTGEACSYEVKGIGLHGRDTWYATRVGPIKREGRVEAAVLICMDITEQKLAAEDLERTKDRFMSLVNLLPQTVFEIDLDGRVTFVNQCALETFGYTQEDVAGGINAFELFLPEDKEKIRENMQRLLNGGQSRPSEYTGIRKDGSTFAALIYSTVITENDQPLGFRGVLVDISSRKRAEEEIKRFKTISDMANYGAAISDLAGNLIYVNEFFAGSHGYHADELVGRHLTIFHNKAQLKKVMKINKELIAHGEYRAQEVWHTHKDGSQFPMLMNGMTIPDESGEPVYMAVTAIDITERKKVEAALQESEEKYRTLFETSPEGIVIIDIETKRYLHANPAACDLLGYSEEEIINLGILDLHSKDDLEYVMSVFGEHSRRERMHAVDIPFLKKDGTTIHISANGNPARIGGKECVVGFLRDITERKLAEEKIAGYEIQLRSLVIELSLAEERERKRIAKNLHDSVGQNLYWARLKLSSLRESKGPAAWSPIAEDLLELINDSLKATQALTFELSPPVLHRFGLKAGLKSLAQQIQQQHGIVIDFQDDGQIEPLTGDQRLILFQVIRELLNNIVKHARVQNAKVIINRHGDRVQIEVSDQGVGFDVSKTYPVSDESNGFGLFSIRERMKHLGGNLEINSQPGRGTRVVLTLDLQGMNEREKGADNESEDSVGR